MGACACPNTPFCGASVRGPVITTALPRAAGLLSVTRSICICLFAETRPYSVARYTGQDALVSLVGGTGLHDPLTSHFAGYGKLTSVAAPLTLELGDQPGPSVTDKEAH